MTLGDYMKQYREEHFLSQRQFATRCGLSNGMIARLERGYGYRHDEPVIPTMASLKKIAIGMGMTLTDLLIAVDDMPISLELGDKDNELSTLQESGQDIDIEIAGLILRLSPEKKKEALRFLRYLANSIDD